MNLDIFEKENLSKSGNHFWISNLLNIKSRFFFRKKVFIKLKQFESGAKAFFRRNCVMWSFISKSNFDGSKAKRHANASRDYFFLNLNWIKNILARYQDFGRKNPEISIDFIIFPFQLFDDEFLLFNLVMAMVIVNCFISHA